MARRSPGTGAPTMKRAHEDPPRGRLGPGESAVVGAPAWPGAAAANDAASSRGPAPSAPASSGPPPPPPL
eukprot:2975529-Alexandrium_andersonii.AAC.1